MPQRYKPTKEDCRIIRDCAQRSAGFSRVEICPSTKVDLAYTKQPHMNVCFVSDDPEWNDTDLFDNAYAWKDFSKGVELTDDGRGIFDFYVYAPISRNLEKELQTNVTAYYANGKLVRVTGTCNGTMWAAPVSYAPQVIADGSGEWAGNALRFRTREAAEAWVADLACRWTLVRQTRVVESTDPITEDR